MYFIYILHCKGNTLYTGITTDIQKRIQQHCGILSGGAKYTRSHPPLSLELVYSAADRAAASRLEYAIKQLTREQKDLLVKDAFTWSQLFPGLEQAEYRRESENYPVKMSLEQKND